MCPVRIILSEMYGSRFHLDTVLTHSLGTLFCANFDLHSVCVWLLFLNYCFVFICCFSGDKFQKWKKMD